MCCVYDYGVWIDARTLHKELNVRKKFADWIKVRIDKYEFLENDDYKLDFPKKGNQNSHGGDRKTKYYSLTLDMAKELSMVENNKVLKMRIISFFPNGQKPQDKVEALRHSERISMIENNKVLKKRIINLISQKGEFKNLIALKNYQ